MKKEWNDASLIELDMTATAEVDVDITGEGRVISGESDEPNIV